MNAYVTKVKDILINVSDMLQKSDLLNQGMWNKNSSMDATKRALQDLEYGL